MSDNKFDALFARALITMRELNKKIDESFAKKTEKLNVTPDELKTKPKGKVKVEEPEKRKKAPRMDKRSRQAWKEAYELSLLWD